MHRDLRREADNQLASDRASDAREKARLDQCRYRA